MKKLTVEFILPEEYAPYPQDIMMYILKVFKHIDARIEIKMKDWNDDNEKNY